ncbi:MAG: electron transporter, partial [Clostridia bacterium]|nr:electron transporter [Clostridia bacterium]
MKKIDLKNVCKSALPLILICLIISSLLTFVNFLTEGAIEKEKNLESENARKSVLSSASYFEKSKIDSIEYYKGFNDENLTGYVFLTTAKGYGGKIEVITGISCNGTISG